MEQKQTLLTHSINCFCLTHGQRGSNATHNNDQLSKLFNFMKDNRFPSFQVLFDLIDWQFEKNEMHSAVTLQDFLMITKISKQNFTKYATI